MANDSIRCTEAQSDKFGGRRFTTKGQLNDKIIRRRINKKAAYCYESGGDDDDDDSGLWRPCSYPGNETAP